MNAKIGLRKMKIQLRGKLIITHLDINSVRNKFHFLSFMIENNLYILLISGTNLYDSFSSGEFKICEFSMPYRYDRDSVSGGLLLYIKNDIPMKLLSYDFGTNVEKNSQLKLFYEKKCDFSMVLTIHIEKKFQIT